MSVKSVVIKQNQAAIKDILSKTGKIIPLLESMSGKWVHTIRQALNMSGAQLARRLGVTRARVLKAEQSEVSGAITINSMHNIAEALGCRFVYALIPTNDIEEIILKQARKKAIDIVDITNQHMSLEDQALSTEQIEYEINRLAKQILEEMPRDLWNDYSEK